MSYVQRPCVCGGTSFIALEDIQLHYGGVIDGAYTFAVTVVVCQQCTRTEMFTRNADQVARHVPNRTIVAGQS